MQHVAKPSDVFGAAHGGAAAQGNRRIHPQRGRELGHDTLTGRIELAVGRDPQYIRINGTIVGGLVGLLIFAVTQLF